MHGCINWEKLSIGAPSLTPVLSHLKLCAQGVPILSWHSLNHLLTDTDLFLLTS